jgi:hypothetical protein
LQDPRIHPIFSPDNFSPELDYQTAFQEASLLASRLLKSQQSYHWLFALCFGKNKRSGVPYVFGKSSRRNVPEEYTTDRGIGELTDEEMRAVDSQLTALSRRVHFIVPVEHLSAGTLGETVMCDAQEGQQGRPSTIWIEIDFYKVMIQSGGKRPSSERALLLFAMATVLLHEMAHAAHMHIMGSRPEDFFEDALAREAGFDWDGAQRVTLGTPGQHVAVVAERLVSGTGVFSQRILQKRREACDGRKPLPLLRRGVR